MSIGIFPEGSVTAIQPLSCFGVANGGRPSLNVSAPEFGRWLASLRESRPENQRSHERIAQLVRPYVERVGLTVPASSIVKYEKGRVPNWPVLAALARVYKKPLTEMLLRLAQSLEFPGSNDLIGQSGTLQSPPHPLGVGDASSTADRLQKELRERTEEVEAYKELLSRAHELGTALVALTTLGDEGAPPTGTEPRRRRRH